MCIYYEESKTEIKRDIIFYYFFFFGKSGFSNDWLIRKIT